MIAPPPTPTPPRTAAIQAGVLVALSLLLVRNDLPGLVAETLRSIDAAHFLALPVFVLVLWARRRRELPTAGDRGSALGLLLMLGGAALFALSAFPFNYQQPRRLAVFVLIAGAIFTAGGWRAIRFWAPMLLLLAISIPIGVRVYARFIVLPETFTLAAVGQTLDVLPGVLTDLQGLDLSYEGNDGPGTIALGEPNRGAQLLLANLSLGLLVVFSRVRPLWQLGVAAIAAIPLVLLANYARLLIWGLVSIAMGAHPLSGTPRTIATIGGLFFAWFFFAALVFILDRLVTADTLPEAAADG